MFYSLIQCRIPEKNRIVHDITVYRYMYPHTILFVYMYIYTHIDIMCIYIYIYIYVCTGVCIYHIFMHRHTLLSSVQRFENMLNPHSSRNHAAKHEGNLQAASMPIPRYLPHQQHLKFPHHSYLMLMAMIMIMLIAAVIIILITIILINITKTALVFIAMAIISTLCCKPCPARNLEMPHQTTQRAAFPMPAAGALSLSRLGMFRFGLPRMPQMQSLQHIYSYPAAHVPCCSPVVRLHDYSEA